MFAPMFTWWLAIQLLSVVTLPLTILLFGHLPLKGYPFSKTLGLLLISYVSWLIAMLNLVGWGSGAVFLALLIVGGGGVVALPRSRLFAGLQALRVRWRSVLLYEALFAASLIIGLWIRWSSAGGAAISGTEKPMDLAFLSSILQSDTLPPQDPWLAGYPVNYYYLGYLCVATLAVLSRTSVEVAFTLGLATIFTLTATMVAGLVTTLIEVTGWGVTSRKTFFGTVAAALLGVLLVLGVGNQMGVLEELIDAPEVVALDGRQIVDALRQRLNNQATIQLRQPTPSTGDFGVISTIMPTMGESFNWWWPSRALWDDVPVGLNQVERRYTITEFPFFSFYLGDLHPHVLALPFDLLAVGLAFATLTLPHLPRAHKHGWLLLSVSGIVIGSLYIINAWDVPTYSMLYAGALALLYRRLAFNGEEEATWRAYAGSLGMVVGAMMMSMLPFLLTFRSLLGAQTVAAPWSRIPIVRSLAKIIAFVPDHAGLHSFAIIFGLFFLLLLGYAVQTTNQLSRTPARAGRVASITRPAQLTGWLGVALTLLLGLLVGFPLLALIPLALILIRTAWQSPDQPVQTFVLWTIAVGALVLFGTDVIYLRDNFDSRMNTIFKFYYQVWVMWGTLAAYATWALLRNFRRKLLTLAWSMSGLILLVGACVYPVQTLRTGRQGRPPDITLNGLAFLAQTAPDELAAITWIRQHTEITDILLTAVGSSYDSETGRIAAATGRPTLLGWSGSHERLWRRGSPGALTAIGERERDIPLIYMTTDADEAQELLKQYKVKYIYIGPAEHRLYPGLGLDKFSEIGESVFQQGQVQIYRLHDS